MSAACCQLTPCILVDWRRTGGGRCGETRHVERNAQLELDFLGVEKPAGIFWGERSGYRGCNVKDVSLCLWSAVVVRFRRGAACRLTPRLSTPPAIVPMQ